MILSGLYLLFFWGNYSVTARRAFTRPFSEGEGIKNPGYVYYIRDFFRLSEGF